MESTAITSDTLNETEPDATRTLLAIFENQSAPWLQASQLKKLVPGTESCFKKALNVLLDQELVINLGQLSRSLQYSLKGNKSVKDRQIELTKVALLSMSTPGQVKAMPLSEKHKIYTKVIPTKLRSRIKSAVSELKREQLVVTIQASGRNYFLYVDALRPFVNTDARIPSSVDVPSHGFDKRAVREAYDHLVKQHNLPDVLIYDLHKQSNMPLSPLIKWLERECRAHRVVPAFGEPTAITPEARKASLSINEQDFLMVRFE